MNNFVGKLLHTINKLNYRQCTCHAYAIRRSLLTINMPDIRYNEIASSYLSTSKLMHAHCTQDL